MTRYAAHDSPRRILCCLSYIERGIAHQRQQGRQDFDHIWFEYSAKSREQSFNGKHGALPSVRILLIFDGVANAGHNVEATETRQSATFHKPCYAIRRTST